jgi:signal peptidase II
MKPKLKYVLLIAVSVFLADHLTKYLVDAFHHIGWQQPIIPGFFDLVHVRNRGAAFGILSSWDSPYRNSFFYIIGAVAMIILYKFIKATPASDKWGLASLGLILGGAWGNLIDRLWRGSVVDFLSFHIGNEVFAMSLGKNSLIIPLTWPAFNIADAAICVGVTVLLWKAIKS